MQATNYKRLWRRNKTSIIFSGGILISLAFGYQDIQQNMQSMSMLKSQIKSQTQTLQQQEQLLEFQAASAKIANARYTGGCLPVVSQISPGHYITLVEGRPVVDRISKQPLPAGTIVCDAHGNTGVIQPNQGVGEMAFSGDRDLIARKLARFKAAQYSKPTEQ